MQPVEYVTGIRGRAVRWDPDTFYMLQHNSGGWFCRADQNVPAVWLTKRGPQAAFSAGGLDKEEWSIKSFPAAGLENLEK